MADNNTDENKDDDEDLDLLGVQLFSSKHFDVKAGAKAELSIGGSASLVTGLSLDFFLGKGFEDKEKLSTIIKDSKIKSIKSINKIKKVASKIPVSNKVIASIGVAYKKGKFFQNISNAVELTAEAKETINQKLKDISKKISLKKEDNAIQQKIVNLIEEQFNLYKETILEENEKQNNGFFVNKIATNEIDISKIYQATKEIEKQFFSKMSVEVEKVEKLNSKIDESVSQLDITLSQIDDKVSTIYSKLDQVVNIELSDKKKVLDTTKSKQTITSTLTLEKAKYDIKTKDDE